MLAVPSIRLPAAAEKFSVVVEVGPEPSPTSHSDDALLKVSPPATYCVVLLTVAEVPAPVSV